MSFAIRLNSNDNLVVSLRHVPKATDIGEAITSDDIPAGHKIAVRPIAEGEPVMKLGQIIGFASRPIEAGAWIHSHNTMMRDFERGFHRSLSKAHEESNLPEEEIAYFNGYRRDSGRVGTRNYLAIMSSVNCSATAVKAIAERLRSSGVFRNFPNIDGVVELSHGGGCSLKPGGAGYEIMKRTQFGYLSNPNIGGAIMVGLGCEGFQIDKWKESCGLSESDLFRTMTLQDIGGTRKAIEAGLEAIREMLPKVNAAHRTRVPASELVLGLQCGGSDGYSGLTANPALGAAVDLLVRQGGTAILSETPEIFGAEHLLMQRAASPELVDRLKRIIDWWKEYTRSRGMELDNNPSPGNKAGGLTTIIEKSLGSVAKGGTTPLREIYSYAERVTAKGFVFMDTPGYDPVSATRQVAGGANVLCFTTGRGSAFGCKPTPSIKLASNTAIYNHMIEDMDINCGDILDGVSVSSKGKEIFDEILAVASGKCSKSEALGYGDSEFIPWEIDAVM